jgi:hypothetical protein
LLTVSGSRCLKTRSICSNQIRLGVAIAYADGMTDVDFYGPNATLTFYQVRRFDDDVRRVIVARLIVPVGELAHMAKLLLGQATADFDDDAPERPHAVN